MKSITHQGEEIARIRDTVPDDVSFVTTTWKTTQSESPLYAWLCSNGSGGRGVFYHEFNARIRKLMERAKIKVACSPFDNDYIFGWACAEGDVVHYVFVRPALRRKGIARALLAELGVKGPAVKTTHWTRDCEAIGGVRFVPSELRVK